MSSQHCKDIELLHGTAADAPVPRRYRSYNFAALEVNDYLEMQPCHFQSIRKLYLSVCAAAHRYMVKCPAVELTTVSIYDGEDHLVQCWRTK